MGNERDWNSEECNNENKVLIEYLRSLMEKIVFDDLLKPTDILKIARNLCPIERHTTGVLTVEEKIQEEIYHIVSNTYFIPVYGKKLIKPTDIISWEDNFPYHFEENEIIANYNLPIKEINKLSQIYQNFSIFKNNPVDQDIFYDCKLKSANKKERKNSLCLLLNCFEKNISSEQFFDDLFLDQKLFLDSNDILICLNEGPFFLKNMNNVPSCIKKATLMNQKNWLMMKFLIRMKLTILQSLLLRNIYFGNITTF